MVTKHYNIHDSIYLRVVNHKNVFDRLSAFETDNVENIDIDIILGNFSLPRSSSYKSTDGKYWIGEHSLYCTYRHKLSFWKIWIEGIDQEKTTIHFYGDPWYSLKLLFMLILEPLITYKLSKKKALVLHASSLSMDNKGYVFTGGTGIGKTTIILKLMNNPNTNYYSDDQAYIRGTTLYSYPLPIGLRKHQVDSCAIALSIYHRGVIIFHHIINTLLKYYPNLTHRVELKNIKYKSSPYKFSAGWQVPIDTIFVLSKTKGDTRIEILSPEKAYNTILKYNEGNQDKLEVMHKYFSAYTKLNSDLDYWGEFRKELHKLVYSDIKFYEVLLNQTYEFDNLLPEILTIMGGR